jgi:hypothetical protein
MERNDVQADRGGGGLSTQDLLEAEPRKEQGPKEQAPKEQAPKGKALREADELVAAVIQSSASTFADHKRELESQWQQGEAATEDLRVALRQYRSFVNQLLSSRLTK